MANIFFGDGVTAGLTGNWNTVANWYLTLGTGGCCGHPGTPAGRVPQAGDSVVLAGDGGATTITTGPANWAGPLTWSTVTNGAVTLGDSAAIYSGAVTVQQGTLTAKIAAGNFPGSVALHSGTITGGNFTGTVTRTAVAGVPQGALSGGRYSPTATCALQANSILNDTNLPEDPGFAVGGGVFAPVITVTGFP